jgi:hypothetical protein
VFNLDFEVMNLFTEGNHKYPCNAVMRENILEADERMCGDHLISMIYARSCIGRSKGNVVAIIEVSVYFKLCSL